MKRKKEPGDSSKKQWQKLLFRRIRRREWTDTTPHDGCKEITPRLTILWKVKENTVEKNDLSYAIGCP